MGKKGNLNLLSRKARLMNVKIQYGDDLIKFNLYSEIKIDENLINDELQSQPSVYAFLTMLHKKLIKSAKEAEAHKKQLWAKLYLKYKDGVGQYGRAPSDDVCKAKVEKNKEYQEAIKLLIIAESNRDDIQACVEVFEQRKDILQTLSANQRKERT
jgi:hypothetical protein